MGSLPAPGPKHKHTQPTHKTNDDERGKTKQAPLLPKLRGASPDYREAASHFSAHDESSPALALE